MSSEEENAKENNITLEGLSKLYDSNCSWLKYNEAKNASLVALCAISLQALLELKPNVTECTYAYGISAFFFLISLLLSIYAFIWTKKATPNSKKNDYQDLESSNLLSVQNIATYSEDEYQEKFIERYAKNGTRLYNYQIDILRMVSKTAYLTTHKGIIFNYAATIYIIGVIIFVLLKLLFAIINIH